MANNLNTPTGTPFEFDIDYDAKKIIIVTQKGTQIEYSLPALRDLYHWLSKEMKGNWVVLGTKGEEEEPKEGTVEEWARSIDNPNGGHYGLKMGRRGRFATYIPSILEFLGFVELEHKSKGNRVRSQVIKL